MTILETDSRMLSTLMDLAVPKPHAVANDYNGTRRVLKPRMEVEPENQPRRVDAFDPNNNDNFALFPEDDSGDDDMLNFMTNMGMPQTVAQDLLGVYELFLVQGASRGIARSKVCELFSPPTDHGGDETDPQFDYPGRFHI